MEPPWAIWRQIPLKSWGVVSAGSRECHSSSSSLLLLAANCGIGERISSRWNMATSWLLDPRDILVLNDDGKNAVVAVLRDTRTRKEQSLFDGMLIFAVLWEIISAEWTDIWCKVIPETACFKGMSSTRDALLDCYVCISSTTDNNIEKIGCMWFLLGSDGSWWLMACARYGCWIFDRCTIS